MFALISPVMAFAALVLGILGVKEARDGASGDRSEAIVGIILGALYLVMMLVSTIALFAFGGLALLQQEGLM